MKILTELHRIRPFLEICISQKSTPIAMHPRRYQELQNHRSHKSSTITQLLEGPEWGREEKEDFDQGKDLLSNLCAGHLPAKRPCKWDWDTLQQRPRQRPRLDYAAPFGISHVYHVSTSISQLILYCTDRCMVCSQAGSKKPGNIQT